MILGVRQSSLEYSSKGKQFQGEAEGDNKFQCIEARKGQSKPQTLREIFDC